MSDTTAAKPQDQSGRWRILVVENDPSTAADHARNLGHWGYEVYTAEGVGEALLADARHKIRQYRCHLMLVDMRLLDNDDPTDLSGLDLVKELAPVPSIVVSSYGSLRTASEAVGRSGAIEFIGKEEGPRRLRSAIESFFKDYYETPYRGEIKWAYSLKPKRVIARLFDPSTKVEPKEIEYVVHRLFRTPPYNQAATLRLNVIPGAARSLDSHSLQHSVVFKATADSYVPVVIKIASADQVEAENRNYHQHVAQKIHQMRHSQLQQCEVVGFVGGIRYSFLDTPGGETLKTLADRFEEMSAQQINACLNLFFQETWYAKYQQRSLGHGSLFAAYLECWGKKWVERMQNFPLVAPGIVFPISGGSLTLPNPVAWLLNRTDVANDCLDDATQGIVFYTAVTHGDLHCRNIFVDQHGEPCVIDYERTGPGPILRDFVELEVDVLLQTLRASIIDDPTLFGLFKSLLYANQLDARANPIGAGALVAKTAAILNNLRSLAYRVGQVRDMRGYYWSLLFDIALTLTHVMGRTRRPADNPLLKATVIDAETVDITQIKTADHSLWSVLLLGGMICHRLTFWEKPWPPESWSLDMPHDMPDKSEDSSQSPAI